MFGIQSISLSPAALAASWLAAVALGSAPASAQPTNLVELHLTPPGNEGWVRLNVPEQTGTVFSLAASTNFLQWTPLATTHDGVFDYPDTTTAAYPARFYSVTAFPKTSDSDWKNQTRLPNDPFLSVPGTSIGPDLLWLKFAILLNDPFRVIFQDSQKYDFHYEFASKRLEPFRGMTPAQFDRIALHRDGQQVLLGTLLVPPYGNQSEYGIQFVGQDAYPPELISQYFHLVQATVAAPGVTPFYVPAFEQVRSTETNRAYFESKGIRLASADRWIAGDNVYAPGWALGRLVFFPGTEINAAFTDGRLQPGDILLTDGVPAEIPVLAGVLTLAPSTPNSHVAILAKSFGLPFAYLSDPELRARVQGLVGKDIILRLEPFSGLIKVIELESSMEPALRAEILQLKSPPILEITPKAKYGALSASTAGLTPADIKYFGGKASNSGFLRRQIPDRSPESIGISFDLWDEFLDQVLPSGRTLRAEIRERLAPFTYPPNVAGLKKALADIRDLITRTATFSETQKQAIIQAVTSFGSVRNIRFRSSTNVEDSEQFTGAGLYDSYSGCLGDDLDNDAAGPSLCDPTESNERGVFRAIQKVYASFYNDNAYIERLRHHLDEDSVGMAILVHYSTPDDTELANGVATIQAERGGQFDSLNGDLVTQKGAVSVTNPDGNAKPEVVQGYHHSIGAGGFLKQRSSLIPLGAYVLDWDANYVELMRLFAKVADGYHAYFPQKKQFTLDFEYKKVAPGVLDVKQVREVPVNRITNDQPAYLVHETNSYWTFQGEFGDVFSNHRLKSFWSFHTRNLKLVSTNLAKSLFTHLEAEYLLGTQTNYLAGAPDSFPNPSHTVDGEYSVDRWSEGSGAAQRGFELRTQVRQSAAPTESPIFSLPDFRVELAVSYATPQPVLEWDFDGPKPATTSKHLAVLEPRRISTSTNNLQRRTASLGGVTVDSRFYWPAPPSRGIGDKTAPLARWDSTTITGLTKQPMVLVGDFSQTYRPGHHNFSEEFIFEPALEGTLPPSVLEELRAANVQLIHVLFNFERKEIRVLGLDGKFRTVQ